MKEREDIYKEDKNTRQWNGYHDKSGDSWYGEDQESGVEKIVTVVKQNMVEQEIASMWERQQKSKVKQKERKTTNVNIDMEENPKLAIIGDYQMKKQYHRLLIY